MYANCVAVSINWGFLLKRFLFIEALPFGVYIAPRGLLETRLCGTGAVVGYGTIILEIIEAPFEAPFKAHVDATWLGGAC